MEQELCISVNIDVHEASVFVDQTLNTHGDPLYVFEYILSCKKPVLCKTCCSCGIHDDTYLTVTCSG